MRWGLQRGEFADCTVSWTLGSAGSWPQMQGCPDSLGQGLHSLSAEGARPWTSVYSLWVRPRVRNQEGAACGCQHLTTYDLHSSPSPLLLKGERRKLI